MIGWPVMSARRILLAVDGSQHSDEMIQWAIDNILRKEDFIMLVHVFQRPSDLYMADITLAAVFEETEKAMKKTGEVIVEKAKKHLEHAGFKVGGEFLRSDGKEDIVNVATEEKADILILGSRGLGMIKRSLLGSTSDYCAHHAPCPVICVKS